jgi:hypothetical protein
VEDCIWPAGSFAGKYTRDLAALTSAHTIHTWYSTRFSSTLQLSSHVSHPTSLLSSPLLTRLMKCSRPMNPAHLWIALYNLHSLLAKKHLTATIHWQTNLMCIMWPWVCALPDRTTYVWW